MTVIVRRAVVAATVVLTLLGLAPVAGASSTAAPLVSPAAPLALPTAGTPGSYYVDVWGVSRDRAVTVAWGDGTSSRKTSTCASSTAARRPHACTLRLSHAYGAKGTYRVTIRFGSRVIGRQKAVIPFHPVGWRPPKGWSQPAGWLPYPDGATFAPCSTVRWYYDVSAQPAASAGMHADVVAALALLAVQTNLTFVETAKKGAAQLVVDWGDLTAKGGDIAGLGGRDRDSAFVHFSTTSWWPTDSWAGFSMVTQPDGSSSVGRGWLVVHETMHALGFDHVSDPSSVMNAVAGAHDFSPGDLDGLHTMYLDRPCPKR